MMICKQRSRLGPFIYADCPVRVDNCLSLLLPDRPLSVLSGHSVRDIELALSTYNIIKHYLNDKFILLLIIALLASGERAE